MSNDLTCILIITRREYEFMTARLGAFGVSYSHTKELQLGLYTNSDQNKKVQAIKNVQHKLNISRKFENSLIRISERNSSTFLLGSSNTTNFDEKFMLDAAFYRMENSFIKLMGSWSIFADMKQIYNKKIQTQIYTWNNLFQFEFCQNWVSNDDNILLIIRDLSATNYVEKNFKLEYQFFKAKMCIHFRDIFALFCSNFGENHPFTPSQVSQIQQVSQDNQQLGQHRHSPKCINEFEDKIKPYIQKIIKFNENKNDNTKIIHYWMLRLICISEFVLKSRENK